MFIEICFPITRQNTTLLYRDGKSSNIRAVYFSEIITTPLNKFYISVTLC